MNRPILALYGVVLILFALLVGFTSRWTVFEANALRDNPKNRRELLEEQKIRRGLIRAGDDSVLARSLKQPDGSYVRSYPTGRLFPHAVGYSFVRQGRAGLERFYDDDLSGRSGDLGSLLDRLSGSEQQGDNLVTSLNPAAQRVALQQLGGRKGAVVALDPRTGAIKAARPLSVALKIIRTGKGRSVSSSFRVFSCERMSTMAGYSARFSDFP